MPYVYSKSKVHLYVQVVRIVKDRKTVNTKSKNITVCDYAFVLLAADIKEFADTNYPLRKDRLEKRKIRGQPKTYVFVREVNSFDHKIKKGRSFTLGDDYDIDDVEQQIRFFLKKRFGQI